MTIAACYLSPEGVVLGTDSTSTIVGPDGESSYLDHAQKLFAVGDPGATIGLMTWGLGQIGDVSHRTDERSELRLLGQLAGGYCIAGRMPGGRACTGFAIDWAPWLDDPALRELRLEQPYHWGYPSSHYG